MERKIEVVGEGQMLPATFTCDGEGQSPHLAWSDAPRGDSTAESPVRPAGSASGTGARSGPGSRRDRSSRTRRTDSATSAARTLTRACTSPAVSVATAALTAPGPAKAPQG